MYIVYIPSLKSYINKQVVHLFCTGVYIGKFLGGAVLGVVGAGITVATGGIAGPAVLPALAAGRTSSFLLLFVC